MKKTLLFILLTILVLPSTDCSRKAMLPREKDSFLTRDNVILAGQFFPPGEKELTFILLHGLGSSREEWKGFMEKLKEQGYGFFAYDLRGHGESTRNREGKEIHYKKFIRPGPLSEWGLMVDDLEDAVRYLQGKGIKKRRIGLIGASLGANTALLYASKNYSIPAVILLSPGWNYAGLYITGAIKEYGKRPLALAASPGDEYAYKSSVLMARIAGENGADVKFFKGRNSAHGVQMFDGQLEAELMNWISRLDFRKD